MRAPWWLVLAVPLGCRDAPSSAGTISASASSAGSASASPPSSASAVPPVPGSASPPEPAPLVPSDAGLDACRVVRGPIELALRSPPVLAVRGDALEITLNDYGKPRRSSLPITPVPAASGSAPPPEPLEGEPAAGSSVPCAVSADAVFCPDRSGAVHRTDPGGGGDRLVASSRTGSRVAAATLGSRHAALGYLASRQTSEGWVSEAWLAVDDEPPVRLSEDGSGATSVTFATRKTSVVALMVDARAALTALHVRPVTFETRAQLGEDEVVFVGGPGEHRTAAALALPPSGVAWALMPIARDIGSFGMAAVRVDDPAHVDEPVVWSMYPNGLDPAPVASTLEGPRTWVARVRPETAVPGSTRALELGLVASDGAFAPRQILTTATKLTDASLVADPRGALWVSWVDGTASWLERVVCR